MSNFNFNKVILGGKITKDVELKQTPQGVSVCSFTIAVNRRGKDSQADFINCVAWRQSAEFISNHFKKGSSICVVGQIQTRTYDDKDGNKKFVTEILVEDVTFVDSKSSEGSVPILEEVPPDAPLPF